MQKITKEIDGETNANLGKGYTCQVCSADSTTDLEMREHQESYPGFEPLNCGSCKRRFNKLKLVNKQQKSHTERNHRCLVCEKAFLTQQHLLRHQKHKHFRQKSSQGGVSGKRFAAKTAVKFHQAVHDKNKKFRCHICDKSMASKASLRHHVTNHSGDRPHRCSTCEKTFGKKYHLLRHERRHFKRSGPTESHLPDTSGDKPTTTQCSEKQRNGVIVGHPCPFCNKRFNTEHNLERHQLTAHAPGASACPLCAREFPGAEPLRFHLFQDHIKRDCDSAAKRPSKAGGNILRVRSDFDLNEANKGCESKTQEKGFKSGLNLNIECIDLTTCSSDDDLEIKNETFFDLANQHYDVQPRRNNGTKIDNELQHVTSDDDVSTTCGSDLEDAADDLCKNSNDQVNTEIDLTCKICEKLMSCRESLKEHEGHHLAMRQLWLTGLAEDQAGNAVSMKSST